MVTQTPQRRPLDFPADYIHGFFVHYVRLFLRIFARYRVIWQAPLPRSGFVFASNHRSFLDPVLIGGASRRRVHYFARSSLWKIPPIRVVLDIFGGIPVDREKPQAATMSHTVAVLRGGRALLMFPEGTRTRSGRIGRFRDGPALVARRAGVPVVPVYLAHSERCWPRGAFFPLPGRGATTAIMGAPLWPNPALPPRQRDEDLSRRVEAWLRQQEQRILGPQP